MPNFRRTDSPQENALTPSGCPGTDLDGTQREAERLGQKPAQFFIGRALDRRRGDSELQRISVKPGVLSARSSGQDVHQKNRPGRAVLDNRGSDHWTTGKTRKPVRRDAAA